MTPNTLPLPALALLPPVIGLLIPLLSPILRSPLALFLLSPFLFLTCLALALVAVILVAQTLDARSSVCERSQGALKQATRTLAFATPAAWSVVLTRASWPPTPLPALLPDQLALSVRLDNLLDLVLSSFVWPWYQQLSRSAAFPAAIKCALHHAIGLILDRGQEVDPLSVATQRVLPKLTAHINRFRAAETLLRGADLSRHLTQSSSLDLMLAQKYGTLHPAVGNISSVDTRQTEEAHLRNMIGRVMPKLLPESEAASPAVSIIVREIVACVVLLPLVDMLSEPDFWNRIAEDVTSEVIQQQHLVSRVRHILSLSTSPPGASVSLSSPTAQALQPIRLRMEDISPRTSGKQFESFLRTVARCDSLLDARRLKNDISSEIRKTRVLLASSQTKEDVLGGYKPELIVKYLDRLYTASRAVEKRIGVLSGEPTLPTIPTSSLAPASPPLRLNGPMPTLRTILTTPESLSYFMEFLDRRGKSLSVQFWLTVESFKDPLENVESDGNEETDEPDDNVTLPNGGTGTLREDVQLIWDLYFSEASAQRPKVSQKNIDAVRTFLNKEGPVTRGDERKARQAVLRAQREMEQEMEGAFEEFKRGELWLKAVAAGGNVSTSTSPGLPRVPSQPDLQSRTEESKRKRPLPQYITHSQPVVLTTKTVVRGRVEPEAPARPPSVRAGSADSKSSAPQRHASRASIDSTKTNLDALFGAAPKDRAPLFGDETEERARGVDIEAIQAALTDIIADESDHRQSDERYVDERISGLAGLDLEPNSAVREKEDEEWKLAIPGDPHLLSSIARLAEKVANLEQQSTLLDALTRKAELTGDNNELRLLSTSKAALERELREVRFQREQFVMQERNGILTPERTRVKIVGTTMTDEEGGVGRQVVKYAIQVQQLEQDGADEGEGSSSGWVTARRYSEFWALQQRLKEKFPEVRHLELPAKKLVNTISAVVDARRIALEKYLQTLLTFPTVCASEDLRAFLSRSPKYTPTSSIISQYASLTGSFLSPSTDLMRSLTRLTTSIADDIIFGPSMLDVLIQRLTQQAKTEEELVKLTEAEGLRPLEGETGGATFAAPICDLILSVFELNDRNNWLRRQAVVIILQQVLGSTIERKLRDTLKASLEEHNIVAYFDKLHRVVFPGGKFRTSGPPRTAEEKARTRDEANRKLSALMPDLFSNMIGRSNARRGARRMFAVLQNQRLNRHIIYTVMDEVSRTEPFIGLKLTVI
ncbi:hypothetical protein DACRYDRAFT_78765 [Dacryopinax primogenitus]|uniref:PhoX domain-containing protein n=1 Tax=Dacryopinax primogenitus (strain DJM 731) TaxID=1858805 RepID=M5FXU3_DACPD|nr:uncharacterized protein DACRYDRAFT_78765 [Dacryopinax primogenitus]EJU02861.1 hypothetical protein DACRYDRAFT_78765 [Dacryopinax primogenitus]